MPPSRRIKVTQKEDEKLREVEQNPHLRPKVRLRAQVLRLSNRGSNMARIASYTGRSPTSIARDLDRWGERGMEGLADGSAPGNPPRISQKMRTYMQGRLSEERTWNATQLAEALREEFSVSVTPESVRQHLLAMGYTWKRTCYAPSREPDPGEEKEAREELERLKKGPPKGGSS
jgi:transposase